MGNDIEFDEDRHILFDGPVVSKEYAKEIQAISKIYNIPLKSNCHVNCSDLERHKHVDTLTWIETELRHSKHVHIKKFSIGYQGKLLRLVSGFFIRV
ncbi:hypothetical protein J4G08_21260 [Candidatus Poribacteria bacterium]|nr:hypothetical protein [Candidatus Poribacteria bacterium]